ncbi:MAG TPA: UV DNA damage repair endonuclease UvsE [Verrucomicrobiae bacterium]|nr:UV DNA damage repair endonuclease UvsE [Verrucomicrobiae bacterium]
MRIGYPCINTSLKNPNSSTFRLKSYSEKRFNETVKNNLDHLLRILHFNKKNNIFFFRLSSDIIPFASHQICQLNWKKKFETELNEIGNFILKNNMRVSMHPDQFVILNSSNEKVVENSIKELDYHSNLLQNMNLLNDAKIQIHVGGVYGDKNASKNKFINRYTKIHECLKSRLVIENDDRSYSLKDCLDINKETGIPIVFDVFHHECLNDYEFFKDALTSFSKTWNYSSDGNPIVDYSSQSIGDRRGKHAKTLDYTHFVFYYKELERFSSEKSVDFDIMLEIKDKEYSVIRTLNLIKFGS